MKTFKGKLMLFSSLLCIGMILAVCLFSAFFMEPVYEQVLHAELEKKIDLAAEILADGGLSAQNIRALRSLTREGMCLDISNVVTALHNHHLTGLFIGEGIANCELHTNRGSDIFASDLQNRSADTETAFALRQMVLEQSEIDMITKSGSQMICGRRTPQGYTVIFSVSLARLSQAASFIQRFLAVLGLLLLPLVLGLSYLFSWLFTRPVSRISRAARQMAQGNYDIHLPEEGGDEISALTRDFNLMAAEVARADRLQKDLVSNISHDLRTPLTLMKGYAETIRDITGNDPKKRNEQLGIIIDESNRLSGLVNSVLELGKLEAGTEKPKPVRFDICEFCDELGYRYEDSCEKQGYRLTRDFPEEPHMVTADPALLQRVLHNLLANAFHHIGPDGEIILSVQDREGMVRITVEDHGQGLSEKDAARVFQRYYRSRHDSGKPGAGLGLSIVRAILESHSFAYGVDSAPGAGAKFWFEMPCQPPSFSSNIPLQHTTEQDENHEKS